MTNRKVTPETKERVVNLRAAGHSIKDIATALGIGRTTVGTILKNEGIDTSTPEQAAKTVKARDKRLQELKEKRLDLAEMLMQDAFTMRKRLHSTHRYYERTPEGMVLMELPEPPIRDQKDGYDTIARQVDTHDKLLAGIGNHTDTDRSSVMATMLDKFRELADNMDNEEN